MSENVGTAYLTLVPKMQDGWKGKTEAELSRVDGSSAGKKVGGKFGGALKAGAMLGATALVSGVVQIAQESLEAYASYEQLTGGVDKLYGKASGKVMKYASDAYKTVGMSANQYMETATQFSASMTESLGGNVQKSADQTQKAMEVISDNVNVFGSNMEDVTNAFKGFSKQNYTMLDNLKLGYGGTKEEMQRLLDDATKLSGVKYDISSLSDITDAIEVIQTEMGITGTTAKEAMGTIEGSMAATSAAWENLLVGFADPDADVNELVSNFVDSLANTVGLVAPRLGEILLSLVGVVGTGIESGINGAFDFIAEFVMGWFDDVGASWGEYFEQLGNDVGDYLYETFGKAPERISEGLDGAISAVTEWGSGIVNNARSAASGFITAAYNGITSLPSKFLGILNRAKSTVTGFADNLGQAAQDMVQGMVNGINDAKQWVIDKINELCDNALGAIKSFFGIKSPSRLMRKMFGYVGQGMALGLDDTKSDVIGSFMATAMGITDAASRFKPTLSFGAEFEQAAAPASRTRGASAEGASPAGGGTTININVTMGGESDPNTVATAIASKLKQLNMMRGGGPVVQTA